MVMIGCAQESAPAPTPTAPLVRRIVTLTEDGGRLGWSAALDRIAFDRMGSDGYFDIWTMNPDATAQTCLTCDRPGVPTRHVGNPSWHPGGEYIVFQAQKENLTSPLIDFFANPGAGINNDLYVMDTQGRQARRLVTVPNGFGGVLHPHFSSTGAQLQWAERVSNSGGAFGQWVIRIADFRVAGGVPAIDNIRTYTPGSQQVFYETHGFGPSDQDILFSGNLESGVDEFGIDIYRFNPATGALSNLTASSTEWDEHAHFAPGFNRIAWMSSRGYARPAEAGQLRTEFWLMNADGSGKTQLTRFNQPGQPESIPGQALAADLDWAPDGRRIAAYVMTQPAQNRGRIVMIELNVATQSEEIIEKSHAPDTPTRGVVATLNAIEGDPNLSRWEHLLADMTAAGSLVEQSRQPGPASGRRVARYTQYAGGLPVFRGDVVAQFAGARLLSVFGALDASCAPPAATISPAAAAATAAQYAMLVGSEPLTLSAVPATNGACGSAYVGRGVSLEGPVFVFVDARSGSFNYEMQPGGIEVAGDRTPRASALATETIGGRAFLRDITRPPGIVTLDLEGRLERTRSALRAFQLSDIASDSRSRHDEVVRAFHLDAATAYDLVLTRFGRAGISAGVPIVGVIHSAPVGAMSEGMLRGPFHAGAGRLFVPERRDGIPVVTASSVTYALAQAIVDHTAALAPAGEAGDIRAAFTGMLQASVSDAAWMPAADAGETVTARALAIARTRLAQPQSAGASAIERVFFRAVVELLPPNATLAMARKATLQSARDLFGRSSGVEAALAVGWSAAGVEER